MQTLDDSELLGRFRRERSEAAFAELVRRYLDRVYSLALRKVGGDRHMAEDVSQVVFAALARKAASLEDRSVLGGWLYRATHLAAAETVRSERARRTREQEALFMNENDPGTDERDLARMRSVLDETLSELGDTERDAVWLRFFEERSFADIGARLLLSENTARMRVDRALDKLNTLLTRRGITSTSAAVSLLLANHAQGAAPAGLASSVVAGALAKSTGGAGSILLGFLMANLKIIGTTTALASLLGAALLLQRQQAIARLRRPAAIEAAETRFPAAPAPAPTLAAPPTSRADVLAVYTGQWAARLTELKETLAAYPSYWIPELGLLDDRDWLLAAMDMKIGTESERRILFSQLRETAKRKFMQAGQQALIVYLRDHDGGPPGTTAELQTYLSAPFNDPAILARYRMEKAGTVAMVKEISAVDPELESTFGWGDNLTGTARSSPTVNAYKDALKSYEAANVGTSPSTVEQLQAFLPAEGTYDAHMLEQYFAYRAAKSAYEKAKGGRAADSVERLLPFLPATGNDDALMREFFRRRD